ncbi:MAG: DUF4249 family protein [Bacteroidota bacterium]
MRKNILLTAIILFVSISFQSCVKEVDTGNLPFENKLVIYCMLTSDSLVSVRLSKTNSLLIDDLDSVAGVKVELYENDKFLELLAYKGNGLFYSTKTYPRESYSYTIKASAPGFENVEGTDSIPRKVTLMESQKKSWLINVHDVQQELVDYTTYFTPTSGHGNYYELMFFTQTRHEIQGSSNASYYISFITGSVIDADPCITNEKYLNSYFSTFVFSDETFDGEKKTVHVKMMCESMSSNFYVSPLGNPWDITGPETEYTVLRSVSRAYYLFRKSYYLYISNQELFQKWDPSDPFSVLINTNPSDVFTNVKNGYGIVAAYQHSYVKTTLLK